MKILIITQKVDREDPILGFFHNWILKLSEKFEEISVICLEKGSCDLPKNVEIFSLGKNQKYESGIMNYSPDSFRDSKLAGELCRKAKYVFNFYKYILKERNNYDKIFVHMNQEYVLLGGFIWKILGKKVFMWRNHPNGNLMTQITVWLSDKVFCTSSRSFTAKFKKTEIMPVGIDTNVFRLEPKIQNPKSRKIRILFISRMSPIKKPDLLIEALDILNQKGINFEANFYGDPLPKDGNYYNSLKNRTKELGLDNKINFYKSVPNYKTPKIYSEHNIYVNLTAAGSFDKTILEAAVCGCLLVVVNESLAGEIDDKMITKNDKAEGVAERINHWLKANNDERKDASEKLQEYVLKNHSLNALIKKLCIEIKKSA